MIQLQFNVWAGAAGKTPARVPRLPFLSGGRRVLKQVLRRDFPELDLMPDRRAPFPTEADFKRTIPFG